MLSSHVHLGAELNLFLCIYGIWVLIDSRSCTVFLNYYCHLKTTPFQLFLNNRDTNVYETGLHGGADSYKCRK
jgi:hypothetical protein